MVAEAADCLTLSVGELAALRGQAARSRHRPATRRAGALASKSPGSGTDLREVRAFADGDDYRRIDSAATARTGKLHVRSYHEDRDDATLLLIDLRRLMYWGTQELRSKRGARLLAGLGWQAIERGGSVGAVLFGRGVVSVPLTTGDAHMLNLIQTLVRDHNRRAAETDDLTEALMLASRKAPSGAAIHLATAPEGLPGPGLLSRLARRCKVTVHLILDHAEIAPPAFPLTVSDGRLSVRGRLQPYDPAPQIEALASIGARVLRVLP